ncbi:MAG TPA: hypothetical protein VE691_11140 [Rubrobacter sp.]|jgi:hypothetical protein|nr:hypothetical protein [Rubrobacter sp.]
MAARHGAAVDRPRGDAVAVVDLLEPDAAFGERPLDGLGVGDRIMGIGVQGLDQRPYAARRYPRGDEGARVVERQQASLDPDAPRDEQFAELENPLLSLICRHQIRKHRPGGDERAAALGVGLDSCRGAQRNGNAGARGADRAQRHGARPRLERLAAVAVVGVQVHGSGAGCYRIACLGGEFFGRARCCGMVAIAVERRLQQSVSTLQG